MIEFMQVIGAVVALGVGIWLAVEAIFTEIGTIITGVFFATCLVAFLISLI